MATIDMDSILTAYRLACEAMAHNTNEFNRVAARACGLISGNFDAAAYNIAQSMYNNLKNAATSLDGLVKAAHNAAAAVAGVSSGKIVGVTGSFGGAVGTVSKLISMNASSGSFTDDYIQELQSKWQSYSDSIKDIREESAESAKDAISELVDYRIDMIKEDSDNEKEALDKKLDNLKEFYDKQKEMLQDQQDEERYLKEQAEKRKSVFDLQSEIAMLANDNSAWAQKRRLELQNELAKAEEDLNEFEDEHALNEALDVLDKAYNSQESQIQAEMDALEEALNDPEALYNQALADIKNNTGQLYQEMLEYNRRQGSGVDEDIKNMYEEAYKALLAYKDIYGKDYEGIILSNSTNYKPATGSWDNETISGALYGKKVSIVGYASGTDNATPGLHSLDELGSEYLFTSKDGTHYRVLSGGDKVLNAKATNFIYKFANSGGEILNKIIKSFVGTSLIERIKYPSNQNQIAMGDIIIQGSASHQTVSEIRRAQRDNLNELLKGLNNLNK